MRNWLFPLPLVFLCTLFMSGCDLAQPQNKEQNEQPAALPVEEPKQEEAVNPMQAPPQNGDNTVTVKPGYNFSGRGSSLSSANGENPMGIITVPVKTLFVAKDRLVLQQIDHAMNLYKAEHGSAPVSEAEFSDKIINAYNIQLPKLPANQAYFYDPAAGELQIRKPKNAP